MTYHEAAPHLVFMAYLQRIVNAGGQIEREFAIGTGRADLVVEYGGRKDVIELKLFRSESTLPHGIQQVSDYAKRLGLDIGYLVIFAPHSETLFKARGSFDEIMYKDIKVLIVRV